MPSPPQHASQDRGEATSGASAASPPLPWAILTTYSGRG